MNPLARKLVLWSHVLGWGGIAVLILGFPIGLAACQSPAAGGLLSGLGLVSAVVGAIIGQVGRGMQGRVI